MDDYGPRCYDRAGQPLTMEEWVGKLDDLEYKRVARSEVGDVIISTVWLGLEHHFHFGPGPAPEGPVAIFETMCFGPISLAEEPYRYATEEQALAGHAEMVALVKTQLDLDTPGGADEPAPRVREDEDQSL